MTESSDSSDDDITKFREALDPHFISDSMYNDNNKGEQVEKETEQSVSLRNFRNEEDPQFSFLRVTPEFQNFIAKHLERILEKSLQKQLVNFSDNSNGLIKKNRKRNRIYLFSDSEHSVDATNREDNTYFFNMKCAKMLQQKTDAKYTDKEEREKVESAVVEPQDIKKETLNWAEKRKKKIVSYKRAKDGKLHEVVKQNKYFL